MAYTDLSKDENDVIVEVMEKSLKETVTEKSVDETAEQEASDKGEMEGEESVMATSSYSESLEVQPTVKNNGTKQGAESVENEAISPVKNKGEDSVVKSARLSGQSVKNEENSESSESATDLTDPTDSSSTQLTAPTVQATKEEYAAVFNPQVSPKQEDQEDQS